MAIPGDARNHLDRSAFVARDRTYEAIKCNTYISYFIIYRIEQ